MCAMCKGWQHLRQRWFYWKWAALSGVGCRRKYYDQCWPISRYIHELEQQEHNLVSNARELAQTAPCDPPTGPSYTSTDHTSKSTEKAPVFVEGGGLRYEISNRETGISLTTSALWDRYFQTRNGEKTMRIFSTILPEIHQLPKPLSGLIRCHLQRMRENFLITSTPLYPVISSQSYWLTLQVSVDPRYTIHSC